MLYSLFHRVISLLTRFITLRFLRSPEPKVAVVELKGVIGDTGRLHGRGLTFLETRSLLDRAFGFMGAKAVCLLINSPGGSPVQASRIHDYVRHLSEKKNLPVYAFAEDVCASGGYWLACAGDEIYAHPASIVGSIGVVSAGFGFPELLARHGIERRVYAQGEHKGMLDPFQPERQEDVDRLLSVQHDVHLAFQELVCSARERKLNADAEELFSGAVWSGVQARELGLVDDLGDVESVMRAHFGEKVRLKYFTQKKPMLAGLFSKTQWSQELLTTIEERLHWMRFGV